MFWGPHGAADEFDLPPGAVITDVQGGMEGAVPGQVVPVPEDAPPMPPAAMPGQSAHGGSCPCQRHAPARRPHLLHAQAPAGPLAPHPQFHPVPVRDVFAPQDVAYADPEWAPHAAARPPLVAALPTRTLSAGSLPPLAVPEPPALLPVEGAPRLAAPPGWPQAATAPEDADAEEFELVELSAPDQSPTTSVLRTRPAPVRQTAALSPSRGDGWKPRGT